MNAKRIFGSALLVATALAGMNLRAAVESDVVGYSTIDIKPGFNMIAFNFQPLDGSEEISIQDFVENKEALVAGLASGVADQIQVWDGTAFTAYFYRAKHAKLFPAGPAWVKVGTDENGVSTAGTPTTDTIPRGSGVWFARPTTKTAGTITVSGKVSSATATHTINPGFNMISAAFPAEMALNNGPIDWAASGAVAGLASGVADQIQVWDGEAFTAYFYRAKHAKLFPAGPAWVKVGTDENGVSTTGTPTTDTIPAGKGFWYARPASKPAGTLTETSPIAE